MTEDKMVEWHYWLNGDEFELTLGDGEGPGSQVCYSPWSTKSHTLLSDWIFLRTYSFLRIMLELLDSNNKIITDTIYWILALWNRCFHSYNILLFSCSVLSDFLWSHGLKPTRLPCPSPFPGVCSNYCPSSWWCHPTIPSSVIPLSSCLQSVTKCWTWLNY